MMASTAAAAQSQRGAGSLVLDALPFIVDSWTAQSPNSGKPAFLTHAHKDHTLGIEKCAADVYCTRLTHDLLLCRQPEAAATNAFHLLQTHQRVQLSWGAHAFTVTALDAGHCPGACMLLFRGSFGSILHSGDCRLTPEVLRAVEKELEGEQLDLLYLDCTFGDLPLVRLCLGQSVTVGLCVQVCVGGGPRPGRGWGW